MATATKEKPKVDNIKKAAEAAVKPEVKTGEPTPVSPGGYDVFKQLFSMGGKGETVTRPDGVDMAALKYLSDPIGAISFKAGVVGKASKTLQIKILKHIDELKADPTLTMPKPTPKPAGSKTAKNVQVQESPQLPMFTPAEQAENRAKAKAYLDSVTAAAEREHNKRLQTKGILSAINAEAERLYERGQKDGPAITYLEAQDEARATIGGSYRDRVIKTHGQELFLQFGIPDDADTSMRDARN